jgi:hypothetical protein
MSYTCRQFVEAAFAEIGLGSAVIDLQPEDLQYGLQRLDAMMATWNALGIRLGYPIPLSPMSNDLDALTGVPDSANEGIITNLAIRIGPKYGKVISEDTKKLASSSYDVLMIRSAMPSEYQFSALMPRGAGNKTRTYDNYMPNPNDPVKSGGDGAIEFN